MYFSELLTKVTIGGQNQVPDKKKVKRGLDIMNRAQRNNDHAKRQEDEIICRIINGNRIKKRRVNKEEKEVKQEQE